MGVLCLPCTCQEWISPSNSQVQACCCGMRRRLHSSADQLLAEAHLAHGLECYQLFSLQPYAPMPTAAIIPIIIDLRVRSFLNILTKAIASLIARALVHCISRTRILAARSS